MIGACWSACNTEFICAFVLLFSETALVAISVQALDSDSSFDKRLLRPANRLHVLYESNSISVTEYVCSQAPCPLMQAREAGKAA